MTSAGADVRRRVIALLLARGEIGPAPDRDGGDEAADGAVDGEADAGVERGESVHRAA